MMCRTGQLWFDYQPRTSTLVRLPGRYGSTLVDLRLPAYSCRCFNFDLCQLMAWSGQTSCQRKPVGYMVGYNLHFQLLHETKELRVWRKFSLSPLFCAMPLPPTRPQDTPQVQLYTGHSTQAQPSTLPLYSPTLHPAPSLDQAMHRFHACKAVEGGSTPRQHSIPTQWPQRH